MQNIKQRASNKTLSNIISERKKWLNSKGIEDWNSTDTAFIADKYLGLKINELLPIAEKLLKNIIGADPNVINDHKSSDVVIRELHKQCKNLVTKIKTK